MTSTNSNIDKMRAWYKSALASQKPTTIVTSVSIAEMLELQSAGSKAMECAGARMRGNGDITKNGFEVLLNGGTFKINPPSTQKKGVAETSREAYHSLNLAESVELVAKAAIELAKSTSAFTDVELAKYMGMQPAIISARRNNIEKAGVVVIDKVPYKLQSMGRKKNPSGKTANAWRLVAEAKQAELF